MLVGTPSRAVVAEDVDEDVAVWQRVRRSRPESTTAPEPGTHVLGHGDGLAHDGPPTTPQPVPAPGPRASMLVGAVWQRVGAVGAAQAA